MTAGKTKATHTPRRFETGQGCEDFDFFICTRNPPPQPRERHTIPTQDRKVHSQERDTPCNDQEWVLATATSSDHIISASYANRCVTEEFAAPASVSVCAGLDSVFGGNPAASVKPTPGVSLQGQPRFPCGSNGNSSQREAKSSSQQTTAALMPHAASCKRKEARTATAKTTPYAPRNEALKVVHGVVQVELGNDALAVVQTDLHGGGGLRLIHLREQHNGGRVALGIAPQSVPAHAKDTDMEGARGTANSLEDSLGWGRRGTVKPTRTATTTTPSHQNESQQAHHDACNWRT